MKNDKLWHEISQKLKTHSWEQCKNKFKYLKSKYLQKVDNMGTHSTGASNIRFEYFREMNEIFSKQPNVQPVAIPSSSRGKENIEHISKYKVQEKVNAEKRKHEANPPENGGTKKLKHIPIDIYREVQEMKETGRNKKTQGNYRKNR